MKSKIKRDRLFIMVAALVSANLSYKLILNLMEMFERELYACAWCWALILANGLAIVGMLWLLQNYRRRRRIEDRETERETETEREAEIE